MNRVLDAARVQTLNPASTVAMPLFVLALVFVLNLALVAALNWAGLGPTAWLRLGALFFVYFAVFGGHFTTMTQSFPFALGLGVTRRNFYLAALLVVAGQAVVVGLVLVGGLLAERATGGWGMDHGFFGGGLISPEAGTLPGQFVIYAALVLVSAALGLVAGGVRHRWGSGGVFVAGVGLSLGAIAVVGVVRGLGAWPAVQGFVAGPPLAATAGVLVLLAALLAGLGWLTLRRATPSGGR